MKRLKRALVEEASYHEAHRRFLQATSSSSLKAFEEEYLTEGMLDELREEQEKIFDLAQSERQDILQTSLCSAGHGYISDKETDDNRPSEHGDDDEGMVTVY